MSALAANLSRVQDRIAAAARRAGRDPSGVTLIAVSKTHPPEIIQEAFELGIRHFGENRVEEAGQKIPAVWPAIGEAASSFVWHMLGHIQSRKADAVADLFTWVHSVDSLKLAERLNRFSGLRGKVLNVLLECNVSGESTKQGFAGQGGVLSEAFRRDVEAILGLPHLTLAGLMTMAPIVVDPEQARSTFRALRSLRDKAAASFPGAGWHHLSMGMTDDFEVAIEEGATMVRVGRAIFGERRSPT